MKKKVKKYDYLIIGAGLSGCFLAYQLTKAGNNVLIVEKDEHIGGVCYTKETSGIEVHIYGPHIYRTNNKENWDFLNNITPFNNFINEPIANYHGELYNMPFNMNTFNRIWPDVITPAQARNRIYEEISKENLSEEEINANLENKAISLVGRTIYEKLIKGYTEKQWNVPCSLLPSRIISVLPVRFTYNNNYFSERYQGIPIKGYTYMIQTLLDRIRDHSGKVDIKFNTTIENLEDPILKLADKVICTGRIDYLFDYQLGHLPYRGARFSHSVRYCNNYQGVAVMNFTDTSVPYLRRTEHKHFMFGDDQDITIISEEYSVDADDSIDECFYPINNKTNQDLQDQYVAMLPDNFYTCGVCGDYQPYTMDGSIEACKRLLNLLGVSCILD